jgi:hypothetical protein
MEAAESPQQASPPLAANNGLVSEIWSEHRPVFKALIADALLFLSVLCALLLCSASLHLLERAGYERSRLAFLESLHYYAYLAVWTMFLVDLILKLSCTCFGDHIDSSSARFL